MPCRADRGRAVESSASTLLGPEPLGDDVKKSVATIVGLALAATLLAGPGPSDARARHGRRHEPVAAGAFDYYVLSLTWSPEHCAQRRSPPNDTQCGVHRRFGFVTHGLWPQYGDGGYPQSCPTSDRLSSDLVDGMMDIMPSRDLVRHEWQKHGTCSGASPSVYFRHTREAFAAVTVPTRYKHPEDAFRVTAGEVRDDFRASNPRLPQHGIAVRCDGRFLREVRICLSKAGLEPRTCGASVKDDCRGLVTVRPLK